MNVRSIKKDDVEVVYKFWQKHYKVSDRDTVDRIEKFITKNAGISSLAEEGGEVIGTTLGSYDGRKGYIYKVVVREDFRGTGLGKKLVKSTLDKMMEQGALDIRVNCDERLVEFYKSCGFNVKKGLVQLQIKKY